MMKTNENTPAVARPRIVALDVMRGALVAGMIAVNSPGDDTAVFHQLHHVYWNGVTFADVIAPGFLWIVGVSAALSLRRRGGRHTEGRALLRILLRAVAIFSIGVLIPVIPTALAGPQYPIMDSVKFMDILQRIGLAYLLAAPVVLHVRARGRALAALLLLVVYLIILLWVPGPLPGAGPFDRGANAAQWLDPYLLGRFGEYGSHSVLSTLPAAALMLLGSIVGETLSSDNRAANKRIFAIWFVVLLAGCVLSLWIPLNRRILTPSFVLVIASSAAIVLLALRALTERSRRHAGFLPFVALGANPILMFAGSEIIRALAGIGGRSVAGGPWTPYWTLAYQGFAHTLSPAWASEAVAFLYTAAFIPIAVVLYRRHWIVKV